MKKAEYEVGGADDHESRASPDRRSRASGKAKEEICRPRTKRGRWGREKRKTRLEAGEERKTIRNVRKRQMSVRRKDVKERERERRRESVRWR